MRIQYLKHPDTPHWSHDPMVALGEDEHGLWFGSTAETWLQKGEVAVPRTLHEKGFRSPHPFVQLIVPDGWWTLVYNGTGRDISHYVDVVTPAIVTPASITLVDLDLDVIRSQEGDVTIDDEDEFLVHLEQLGYPPFWVDKARTTAAELLIRLERRDEPFAETCAKWRRRLISG